MAEANYVLGTIMGLSFWQILLVATLLLLLFGRGRIPQLMGDLAGGIKSFRSAMKEDETAKSEELPAASDNKSS